MIRNLPVIAAALSLTAPAFALSPNVFVSSKGSDVASCGATTAPCRSFQYAHNQVMPDGIIAVMDSGEYGPVKITKSVSILNDGAGVAMIFAAAAPAAIYVDATATKVTLRGLTVDGGKSQPVGLNVVNARAAVSVSKCVFRNFSETGVTMRGGASFIFSEVDIADNTSAGAHINGLPLGGPGNNGIIKNSRFSRNQVGIRINSTYQYPGTNSIVAKNVEVNDSATGFYDSTYSPDHLLLSNVTITGVNTSVFLGLTATVHLARSTLSGEIVRGTGSGYLLSSGDNHMTTGPPPPSVTLVPTK